MPHRHFKLPENALIRAFESGLAKRHLKPDASQLASAGRLQQLFDELLALKQARRTPLRKLLLRPKLPRGVYMWGGVGRGKSMLMNCFFDTLPFRRKRRIHFHAFMREVHERLQALREENDPLMIVAAAIAQETRLLCFDEFHVSDIADAMILGRLIEAMVDKGVVIFLTTNYPPDGLYPNGLQRQNFLPTIEFLKRTLDVVELDAGVDYRLRSLENKKVFIVAEDPAVDRCLEDDFAEMVAGQWKTTPVELLGRQVPVRRQAMGVIWFDFATLCGGPRSQNDYLDIARGYHTVFLTGIPKMSPAQASEARRFTWLIDILYDHRVKLIATAAVPAEALYTEGAQAGEFTRTVSRLIEMQSREYLSLPHLA